MSVTLSEIGRLIGGDVIGDGDTTITNVAGIEKAGTGDITFVANSRCLPLLKTTGASAVIVGRGVRSDKGIPLIETDNPYFAFVKVMELFASKDDDLSPSPGIHATVVLGKNVKIGNKVSLQPYVVIDDNVEIGDNVIIYPNTYIGKKSRIGEETLIYSGVTIREKTEIGKRTIIHSGVVIGGDGLGFIPVGRIHYKIPHIGTVIIGDDVEIGANVTIDRATIGETIIEKGVKIDNLVQIAHNVVVGENSMIVAQAGISGSTIIGKRVTMAGQSGTIGHIKIGDNTTIASRAVVTKSLPPNSFVSGVPARPHQEEQRIKAARQRLPQLRQTVRELLKRVEKLENKLSAND
ncbi:UDP-3-O-(3-hydroxymyristoyl)glucosamine N-acyltransferase [candidate division NPL-UPA2 bacterium Unc8]|uniref:UDP-3-O-acylglucosamine N-acyltransferase n=1 Tax=candidate division NPL-UPA2 bacterium Unc8 TaxID=1980939 RepID=A0A399FX41_UNCN2|nr:UDP-3-O-acylglucosamine N-acyltransferase [Bacillota bacterium]MBT9146792.1 UDP-3-O-acylglucosamine N-acyltransferase [Bacillota bacterium]RII00988.1 MAG: UDP-3-O-(3-hydroxymyristoyl)glucosamine N-acyltransferase [candidate division NPL-UPA2 bacterium Unc8]